MHGPFSVRAWSIQRPLNSRLTSVFLKRSSAKRAVNGSFFLCIPCINPRRQRDEWYQQLSGQKPLGASPESLHFLLVVH